MNEYERADLGLRDSIFNAWKAYPSDEYLSDISEFEEMIINGDYVYGYGFRLKKIFGVDVMRVYLVEKDLTGDTCETSVFSEERESRKKLLKKSSPFEVVFLSEDEYPVEVAPSKIEKALNEEIHIKHELIWQRSLSASSDRIE